MSFSDVGNLKCIPFEEIEPGTLTEAHEYLVKSTANLLGAQGRNWLPIIVREIAPDRYEVISNSFGYAVAEEACLEKVWCIVADDTPETAAISQALAGETVLKTNLSTASRNEISEALDYLISQPNSPLKGTNLAIAVTRIDEAPRQYWTNFQPITKLGCRITAGKKLKALEQVFYLEPKPIPADIRDAALLETFGVKQLRELAQKRQLKGFSKKSKAELVELLTKDTTVSR